MSLKNVLIGIDQLANTLLGGDPDETLSARSWRLREKNPRMHKVIDTIFFFDKDHCRTSYESELLRKQLPEEYSRQC